MINHPNEHVQEFVEWVRSEYRVTTKTMSSTLWGRFLQWCPYFDMAAIQLGRSIWINDQDKDHDSERDYWKNDQPFACIALVAHELWHVLQKRDDRTSRWRYLKPQVYASFMVPGLVLSAIFSPWLMTLWASLMVWFLLPTHASERLRIEAEAYSWNRCVVGLLCDYDEGTLGQLLERHAVLLASKAYYWPTRQTEEAARFLVGYNSTPDLEPALTVKIKQTVFALKTDIR